jgi:hypothetical protein
MDIDVTIGAARLVVDPPLMMDGREVSPSSTVADITKVVVAVCRALGTEEADDLARFMRGEVS